MKIVTTLKPVVFFKKEWLAFFILSACLIPLFNAQPVLMYQKVYTQTSVFFDATSNEVSFQPTVDGGYILCGTGEISSDEDVKLIKVDVNGNVQWAKTYDTGGRDNAFEVWHTSDGGYAIIGQTNVNDIADIFLIRTNNLGDVLWANTYGGSLSDRGRSLQQTSDGGFAITGFSNSFSGDVDDDDLYVIKTDANGNVDWSRTFGANDDEFGNAIRQTSDGGYIIAGTRFPSGSIFLTDAYVIKLSSSGALVWEKDHHSDGGERLESIEETSSGDYIASGSSSSGGSQAGFLMKINTAGNVLWAKKSSAHKSLSAKQTTDNGYIFTGPLTTSITNIDALVLKSDENGNFQWGKIYGNGAFDQLSYVHQTSDGGYAFVGLTSNFGDRGLYFVKTNEVGTSGCNEIDLSSIATTVTLTETSLSTLSSVSTIVTALSITESDPIINVNELCSATCTTPLNIGILGPNSLCAGETSGLSAIAFNGTSPFSYLWSTGAPIQFNIISSPGAYSVTVEDNEGCIGTASINVQSFLLPLLDIGPDKTVCSISIGSHLDAGSTFASYLWNTGETTQGITVSADGTYCVTATDVNGCEASDCANLLVDDPKTPTLVVPAGLICEGETVCFTNGLSTGGNHNPTFLWDFGNGQTATTFTACTTYPTAGTYNVSFTCTNVCGSFSENTTVTVNPNPVANITGPTSICFGDNINLGVSGTAGFTCDWDINGTFIGNVSTVTFPATDAFYNVEILCTNTSTGCESTDAYNITVNPLPNIFIPPVGPLCVSDAPVTLTPTPSGGTWTSPSGFTGTINPATLGPGTYSFTYSVTNSFGCTNSQTIQVVITSVPNAAFIAPTTICDNAGPQTLVPTTAGGQWLGDFVDQNGVFDPAAAGAGTHTVTYVIGIADGVELVNNGDFEDKTACPTNIGISGTSKLIDWHQLIDPSVHSQGADYFNSCFVLTSTSISVDVPNNLAGTQSDHTNDAGFTGDGYVGFVSYESYSPLGSDYREYLYTELNTPMIAGESYSVQMYVSLADFVNIALPVGMYLSIINPQSKYIPFTSTNNPECYPDINCINCPTDASCEPRLASNYPRLRDFPPQIAYGKSSAKPLGVAITDRVNWVKVSGTFIASGGEKFLTIGTFADNFHPENLELFDATGTPSGLLPPDNGYYYVDDVSVRKMRCSATHTETIVVIGGSQCQVGICPSGGGVSVIDASATIHASATIGTGAAIGAGVVIEKDVVIGNNVVIEDNSIIRKQSSIGECSIVGRDVLVEKSTVTGYFNDIADNVLIKKETVTGNEVSIGAGTIIEKNAAIGNKVVIGETNEFKKDVSIADGTCIGNNNRLEKEVNIGTNAIIRDGATVLKNASIGNGSIIGNNTLIKQDAQIGANATVEDGQTVGSAALVCDEQTVNSNVADNTTSGNCSVATLPTETGSVVYDCAFAINRAQLHGNFYNGFTTQTSEIFFCPGQQLQFTPENTSASYLWNFGDCTTSSSYNPIYTLGKPGTYVITLTQTTGTVTETYVGAINVFSTPAPDFTANVTSGCGDVIFEPTTDLGDLTPPTCISDTDTCVTYEPLDNTRLRVKFNWDFGTTACAPIETFISVTDILAGNENDVSCTYPSSGNYEVTLIATLQHLDLHDNQWKDIACVGNVTESITVTTASGNSVVSHQKISDTEGGFTGILDNTDFFGSSIAPLGDLDGDGVDDIAVGALFDDDGAFNAGAIWILFLNADGTVKAHQKISNTEGGFTGTFSSKDLFGIAAAPISCMGDLDGDGVADLAVGADVDDDGGLDKGAVWILFLNTDGTVKGHQKISDTQGNFTAFFNGKRFGQSVTCIGDLDSDGVPDLAVGMPRDNDGGGDRGAVFILFMNTNGTVKSYQKISSTQGGFGNGLTNADRFGNAISSLGDLDNDGVPDIAVGAFLDSDLGYRKGAVWILFLNANGTVKAKQKIDQAQGNFTGVLDIKDFFGASVETIGDFDADGNNDLLVGARFDDDGGADRGAVWILFLNSNGTVKSHQKISSTEGGFAGPLNNGDQFGRSIALIGDINGGGTPDLAVGANGDDDGGGNRGAVWVLFMDCDDPSARLANNNPKKGGRSVEDNIVLAEAEKEQKIIEVQSDEQINIYPNPNNGTFELRIEDNELKTQNIELSIYNILGEKIYQSQMVNRKSEIVNLNLQPKGTYILHLQTEVEIHIHKIIKL